MGIKTNTMISRCPFQEILWQFIWLTLESISVALRWEFTGNKLEREKLSIKLICNIYLRLHTYNKITTEI